MTTENQNNVIEISLESVENDIKNKKREIIKGEKLLLVIALITAILCDRLFLNIIMRQSWNLFYFTAIF